MAIVLRSNDSHEECTGLNFAGVVSDMRDAHGAVAPDGSMGKIR
jgi:hypothetical protein